MQITAGSKFTRAPGVAVRPVLVVLFSTTASAAMAASPNVSFHWLPAQPQPAASASRTLPTRLHIDPGALVSNVRPALPVPPRDNGLPLLSSMNLRSPEPAAPRARRWPLATGPFTTPPIVLAPPTALGVEQSETTAREAATAQLSATLPAAPRGRTALTPITAPRTAPGSDTRTVKTLRPSTLAPRPVALARQAAAKPRRAGRSKALAIATSSPSQSQTRSLSLTARGIEFDTAALVNGNRAGTVPLLIADHDNISVRLGDVLALLEPLMERSHYDALRRSEGAGEYVTLRKLRESGIAARMDAQDQLVLGSKSRHTGAAMTPVEPARTGGPLFKGPVAVGLYADNLTESPDGSTLTTTATWSMMADVTVKRWKLSADVSYKIARGMTPSAAEQQRSGLTGRSRKGGTFETAGLTDMRISAERSIRLTGKTKLDLLGRATIPTGERGTQRARGRYEMLVDAGVSTKIGKADVWAGAGHRFRSRGFYTPGRDISEFYVGSELPLKGGTTVRADFLSAQSPYRGYAREYSLSGGLSHSLQSGVVLDATLLAFRDAYGKGVQGGLSVRMPMTSF